MKRRIVLVGLAVVIGSVGFPAPARAAFHLLKVSEVFLGTNGNTEAQYVELKAAQSGQGFVHGTKLRLYAGGSETTLAAEVTLSGNIDLPDQGSILFATTQAETLFGVTADAEFTSAPIASGGMACFEEPDGTKIDCVSWGDRDSNADAGNPFKPSEGIPSGATIRRNEGGDGLDAGDDHDNSRRDFRFVDPSPASSGGPATVFPPLIEFGTSALIMLEPEGETTVNIRYQDPAQSQAYSVDFGMMGISATAGVDFLDEGETVAFAMDTNSINRTINGGPDDDDFEGPEEVRLTLREPTDGALLGGTNESTLVIMDLEDDVDAPISEIDRPEHGSTYKRSKLRAIRGSASDDPGSVGLVHIGLRRTMKSGKCRWWKGDGWKRAACDDMVLKLAAGTEDWRFELTDPLPKSVGTKTKFYTAFSRASDSLDNRETDFDEGRNKNRFEIK